MHVCTFVCNTYIYKYIINLLHLVVIVGIPVSTKLCINMNTTKNNPETPSGISKCGGLRMKETN
jgi:hypothetical protein